MFGPMQVTKLFELSKLETVDEAVAKLLEFAEYPKIFRWFQFPTALVVFVAHADSPDSGAVYVYDRKQCDAFTSRNSAIWRALARSVTTCRVSPTSGMDSRPSSSIGIDGPASLICPPRSSYSARTLPKTEPQM